MKLSPDNIKRGMVVRLDDDAFSHCIVRKVERQMVWLERPYCFVHQADMACPTVMVGVERFEVEATTDRLGRFTIVSTHPWVL